MHLKSGDHMSHARPSWVLTANMPVRTMESWEKPHKKPWKVRLNPN